MLMVAAVIDGPVVVVMVTVVMIIPAVEVIGGVFVVMMTVIMVVSITFPLL